MFGFERARQISTGSAQQIAKTAQAFGQDDDVTVLTVQRLTVRTEFEAGEIAAAGAIS